MQGAKGRVPVEQIARVAPVCAAMISPWRVLGWLLVAVVVLGLLAPIGLYVMAVMFEPAHRETSSPLPRVKVRR